MSGATTDGLFVTVVKNHSIPEVKALESEAVMIHTIRGQAYGCELLGIHRMTRRQEGHKTFSYIN